MISTHNSGKTAFSDSYGRKIEYVRLSVTDKCNLRCFYCMPEGFRGFEPTSNYLSFEEIERVMTAFAALGVHRVRLTGGEPLARKGLPDLIRKLSKIPGIDDISMSTNALLLANKAAVLKQAGASRLNVSLDSLKPDRFSQITRGGDLGRVIDGLEAAKVAGFSPIKINMLVMKGINDDEVVDVTEFCLERGFTLRFIETMPIGPSGRQAVDHYVDLEKVKDKLASHYEMIPGVMPGGGPARYMQIAGTDMCVGFITPLSRHFCSSCNRVRLAADGKIHLCLGNQHTFALRSLLRSGISDTALEETVRKALLLKPRKHDFVNQPDEIERTISATGG